MRARPHKHRPLRYRALNIGSAREPTLEQGAALAPWWRRALASVLDSFLLIGVTEGTFAALEGDSYLGKHNGGDKPLVWLVLILIAATLYYGVVMRASDGQTLGKWLLRIRGVRTDRRAMSATRAIWRQVALLMRRAHSVPTRVHLSASCC